MLDKNPFCWEIYFCFHYCRTRVFTILLRNTFRLFDFECWDFGLGAFRGWDVFLHFLIGVWIVEVDSSSLSIPRIFLFLFSSISLFLFFVFFSLHFFLFFITSSLYLISFFNSLPLHYFLSSSLHYLTHLI